MTGEPVSQPGIAGQFPQSIIRVKEARPRGLVTGGATVHRVCGWTPQFGGAMRKIAFAALIALALATVSAVPALATSGNDHGATITVTCALDRGTQVDINGNLIVPDGSHGPGVVWLYGSKNGHTWYFTWQARILHVVKGQTSYSFTFDADLDWNHFMDYRVIGFGTESRVINRDECGFRVPEAPASPLLLLGAFPAGGLVAVKATGVRVPMPHFRRIA